MILMAPSCKRPEFWLSARRCRGTVCASRPGPQRMRGDLLNHLRDLCRPMRLGTHFSGLMTWAFLQASRAINQRADPLFAHRHVDFLHRSMRRGESHLQSTSVFLRITEVVWRASNATSPVFSVHRKRTENACQSGHPQQSAGATKIYMRIARAATAQKVDSPELSLHMEKKRLQSPRNWRILCNVPV